MVLREESLPTDAITLLNKLKETCDLLVFIGWFVLIFQWHHQYCAPFIMSTLHLLFNPWPSVGLDVLGTHKAQDRSRYILKTASCLSRLILAFLKCLGAQLDTCSACYAFRCSYVSMFSAVEYEWW